MIYYIIFHQKFKLKFFQRVLTHHHVVPKSCSFFSSVEHKRRHFEHVSVVFIHACYDLWGPKLSKTKRILSWQWKKLINVTRLFYSSDHKIILYDEQIKICVTQCDTRTDKVFTLSDLINYLI